MDLLQAGISSSDLLLPHWPRWGGETGHVRDMKSRIRPKQGQNYPVAI